MTVWAFIPARGGSRRCPNKNLADVDGVSLVERAVAVTRATCDRIVVSTDSGEITGRVYTYASIHHRPAHLATDTAQIEDAIAHWMTRGETIADDDVLILAQPTSPFRRPETIRRCVDLVQRGCDSAVTVTLNVQNHGRIRGLYNPVTGDDIAPRTIWNRPIGVRPRSQDAVPMALENGACWAFTAAHFRKTGLRMGGREASVPISWLEAFEIDTVAQLEFARAIAPHIERLIAMEGT